MSIPTIRFTAKPSTLLCVGCLFRKEHSTVCRQVGLDAVSRGLPDCDDAPGYIYVLDESDPRQMSLVEGV